MYGAARAITYAAKGNDDEARRTGIGMAQSIVNYVAIGRYSEVLKI